MAESAGVRDSCSGTGRKHCVVKQTTYSEDTVAIEI